MLQKLQFVQNTRFRFYTLIVICLFFLYLYVEMNPKMQQNIYGFSRKITESNKPLIVIGILSGTGNEQLRQAQRNTWISKMHYLQTSLPFQIIYKFLIDSETRETNTENNLYKDILYLNVSHHGRAFKFGEKMYKWFRYINQNHYNALLAVKMDDDVFLCVPHIFDVLNEIKSSHLYFGFKHGKEKNVTKKVRIDEMFVVLGNNLMTRIANRRYCGGITCNETIDLFDTNYGGTSIGLWLAVYNDIDFLSGNEKILMTKDKAKIQKYTTPTFCDKYILMHKCAPSTMEQLYRLNENSKYDQDTKVSRIGHVTGSIFTGEIERNVHNSIQIKSLDITKDNFPNCDNWAVVTTIFSPSKAVKYISEKIDWCLVIVADITTPTENQYLSNLVTTDNTKRVKFLSLKDQTKMYPALSNLIPNKHFGRKNIGYIYAMHHGGKLIWDFDDDNIGVFDLDDLSNNEYVTTCNQFGTRLVNPYPYFGTSEKYVWPRGFPLQYIKDNKTHPDVCKYQGHVSLGVIQSLANKQPDVDAIFRLTKDIPFNFKATQQTHRPYILPKIAYSPFNAQATLWLRSAFPYMALPISVNGRVSDIWRSYIAQYFMHKNRLSLVFSAPYVIQDRNSHSLIADLDAESDLHLKSLQLLEFIQNTNKENLKDVYEELYKRKYVEEDDLRFVDVWCKTLQAVLNETHEVI